MLSTQSATEQFVYTSKSRQFSALNWLSLSIALLRVFPNRLGRIADVHALCKQSANDPTDAIF